MAHDIENHNPLSCLLNHTYGAEIEQELWKMIYDVFYIQCAF